MSRSPLPLAIFAAAYLALVGIVLAPQGYFLVKPVVAIHTEPAR